MRYLFFGGGLIRYLDRGGEMRFLEGRNESLYVFEAGGGGFFSGEGGATAL